ncbi:PLDc_N domain-containing protein [Alicyclobacillus curvatus]|nr:PLDc_N domain-containing protein [Alicyclobacillus curvatus]
MQELIDMLNIPLGVILPIIAIELILLIMALVDCIRAEQTNGPKWLWILVIVLIEILGPVFYFVFGRKNR